MILELRVLAVAMVPLRELDKCNNSSLYLVYGSHSIKIVRTWPSLILYVGSDPAPPITCHLMLVKNNSWDFVQMLSKVFRQVIFRETRG